MLSPGAAMSESILSVIADSSAQPIMVVSQDGKLILANKAVRSLVDEALLSTSFHGADLAQGLRLPTRAGDELVFEPIGAAGQIEPWVMRGEVSARRRGLAEEIGPYVAEPVEVPTILGLHLARAGQRALEQERSVALFFMEFLGLEHVEREDGPGAAEDALARLEERLRGNLRAVDVVMAQDDGTRAVVAVVSNAEGAEVVAARLSRALGTPLATGGTERIFGVRIGMALGTGLELAGLEAAARAALRQAENSKHPFVSLAGRAGH